MPKNNSDDDNSESYYSDSENSDNESVKSEGILFIYNRFSMECWIR